MKIVNKQQLCSLPKGTLFIQYTPCITIGDLYIKTNYRTFNGKPCFNGCLSLIPDFDNTFEENSDRSFCPEVPEYLNIDFSSIMETIDVSSSDYNNSDLFIVFNKDDIRKMINALMYCLSDAQIDPFYDCEIL